MLFLEENLGHMGELLMCKKTGIFIFSGGDFRKLLQVISLESGVNKKYQCRNIFS